MKKIMIIVGHELKILFTDRQALALLFLMPLALIIFLTFALQDVYQSKVGKNTDLWVITTDPCTGPSSCAQLTNKLKKFNYGLHIVAELPEKSEAELVLVLPSNIDKTIQKLQAAKSLLPVDQIQILFDPLLDQSSRTLVESHLLLSLQGMLIERLRSELKGSALNVKITDVSQFSGLVTKSALGGVVLPNPIQQTVPAWSLFGMFFILIPLTNSMIRDRRLGVFKRLLSFPITKWHLILGKIIPFFIINVLQFAVMLAVGLFILPKLTGLQLDLNFDWWALAAITFASAWAATSYGLLVSCFAETSEQAHAFGAFSVVILAIIGGVMIPSYVMPDLMQKVSALSPLYWGLEAYLDLFVRKLSLMAILPRIYWLLGFSLVACLISSWRFRWTENS
ncbi:MAG: ABC transporter permease [Bdellovibrionaceae bacterium]|nr:ABC transporter permease [Bdellovibrio sp.]